MKTRLLAFCLLGIASSATALVCSANTRADGEAQPAPSGNVLSQERLAELEQIDIPILKFTLKDGAFPDFDCVLPPEGAIGATITNAAYVEGSLVITRKGEELYNSGEYVAKESGMRIKVRGNGSANKGGSKHPKPGYKIKLSKKANLLIGDEEANKSKEWALVRCGLNELKALPTYELAKYLGLGWQPRCYIVTVMINGNYFGNYWLTETVAADKNRVNIEDSGFIVEDDAYWWKPGELYSKSKYLAHYMGWTIKEPDTDDVDQTRIDSIWNSVADLEDCIFSGNEVSDKIDYNSFAAWFLTHDIVNNLDGAGSNIFLIKDAVDPANPYSPKFRMGPVWDMDSGFGSEAEAFSPVHTTNIYFGSALFQLPEFQKVYKDLFNKVKDSVVSDVMKAAEKRLALMPALYESRQFETVTGSTDPKDDMSRMNKFLTARIPILDKMINDPYNGVDNIEFTPDNVPSTIPSDGGKEWLRENNASVYSLDGVRQDSFTKGLNIIRMANGRSIKKMF